MFELIIRNANSSVYWSERFNSVNELNKWLDQEKLRPYWKEEFTSETIDHTPPPPTQEELDVIEVRRQNILTLKQRLKVLILQQDLTAAEVKELVIKLAKLFALKDSLFD